MNLKQKNAVANVIVSGIIGIGVPLLMAYAVIVEGFVLMHMWDWFLSEPFGLPRLGLFHAAGISGIVGLMAHQFRSEGTGKDTKREFGYLLLNPWARFLVAWLVYKAMVSL